MVSVDPSITISRLAPRLALLAIAMIGLPRLGVAAAANWADQSPDSRVVYQLKDVDVPPVPKREIHVRFPRALRREHAEITLRFVVGTDGRVSQLTVVKFSDADMVDPTYDAYSSAEYKPALKENHPVAAWVEVTEVAK